MSKLAVVLFNLGGPDAPDAIKPFLFNLFNDPAILGLPAILRWPLARFIAARRAPVAKEIYAHLGGKSPLLELTTDQARALREKLLPELDVEVFIAMRYWHPQARETAREVREFGPDEIILLPLYPHYSRTTTGSSLKDWHAAASSAGLDKPTFAICCYPLISGLIKAHDDLLRQALSGLAPGTPRKILFSAHGLPKKIIEAGDPYQWQIEQTAGALARMADLAPEEWVVCYQSRVGRLEWIGPSIDQALEDAQKEGRAVIVLPLSFVSEHSETLVELDIEYGNKAKQMGIEPYIRVPAVGTHEHFIAGLADLVNKAGSEKKAMDSGAGGRCCPDENLCPCAGRNLQDV
jgi:ferrochelatase